MRVILDLFLYAKIIHLTRVHTNIVSSNQIYLENIKIMKSFLKLNYLVFVSTCKVFIFFLFLFLFFLLSYYVIFIQFQIPLYKIVCIYKTISLIEVSVYVSQKINSKWDNIICTCCHLPGFVKP